MRRGEHLAERLGLASADAREVGGLSGADDSDARGGEFGLEVDARVRVRVRIRVRARVRARSKGQV